MSSEIPGGRADFDKEFTPVRLALVLGVLMLVAYPEILLGSGAFFFRDTGQFGYPVAWYLRNCLWHGEIPQWNPYNNCGLPFLAQWNTLALYPPSLIYVLAPMPWGMNFFILTHVILAGVGMYFLAWRWFGNRFAASFAGLMFAWNGLALNCWMWPCHIAALGLMPWVVLLCARTLNGGKRPLVLAALVGACQMVTGSPEIIIFTWVMAVGVFAVEWWGRVAKTGVTMEGASSPRPSPPQSCGGEGEERFGQQGDSFAAERLRRQSIRQSVSRGVLCLVALVALVTALSAAQLLPWLDLLAHGDRTASAGDNTWAMPVWGAANFLVPLFRMTGSVTGVFMQPGQEWTTSYYVGILTVLLALVALVKVRNGKVAFLGVMALGGVLCAMGDSGAVLKVLRTLAPALGVTRFPVKFVVLTVFALPLLAAAGIGWVQDGASLRWRRTLIVASTILTITLAILTFAIPFTEDSRDAVATNGVVRWLILEAGVTIMLVQRRALQRRSQLVFGAAFLFLSGLDVSTHVPRQNPTIPARDYAILPPPMTPTPRLGEARAMPGRVVQATLLQLVNPDLEKLYQGQREMLYSDCNLFELIPKVNGFFSIHLREEAAVARLLYQKPSLPQLEEFLGVSQISPELFVWEHRTNFMPWASIGQEPIFRGNDEVMAALGETNFSPREVVFLPVEQREKVSAKADAPARIIDSEYAAEKCSFTTSATHQTMLVLAQSWYHCWRALVDGNEVPLYRANYGFQAVEVPAGQHRVLFVYKDRAFQFGCLISALALLGCAVAWFWRKP